METQSKQKSIYKIVYSDVKGRLPNYLPRTLSTNFRSFKRAMQLAKKFHNENRDVCVTEITKESFIATWEFKAGEATMIFDFNDAIEVA